GTRSRPIGESWRCCWRGGGASEGRRRGKRRGTRRAASLLEPGLNIAEPVVHPHDLRSAEAGALAAWAREDKKAGVRGHVIRLVKHIQNVPGYVEQLGDRAHGERRRGRAPRRGQVRPGVDEEKLVSVGRPPRLAAASVGYLPPTSARVRERPDVDLLSARLVRGICQPPPIR